MLGTGVGGWNLKITDAGIEGIKKFIPDNSLIDFNSILFSITLYYRVISIYALVLHSTPANVDAFIPIKQKRGTARLFC